MQSVLRLFLAVMLSALPCVASAQSPLSKSIDTANLAMPLNQAKQSSTTVTSKIKQVNDALSQKLDAVKKPSVSINLSVEDAIRYQPAPPSLLMIDPAQGFVNNIYLKGTIQAFGIPLNLNYSNDHSGSTWPGGIGNNLFKLDFTPAQFAGIFKSDIQQYYSLRRNAFGGLDMGSYARDMVQQKLKQEENTLSGQANSTVLSQYLKDPAKVTELLRMNEDQIRQKLTAIAQGEAKKEVPVKALNTLQTGKLQQSVSSIAQKQLVQEQQKIKVAAVKELSANANLQQYLNQPANMKALQGMNEQQVVQRLSGVAQAAPNSSDQKLSDINFLNPVPGLDIPACVRRIMAEHAAAQDDAIKAMAHKIVLAQQGGKTLNAAQLLNINNSSNEINSVTKTLTGMKSTLLKQGVDVNKMLQIQQLMDQHGGSLPPTEQAAALLAQKPGTGLQSIFTKVQELKLGAFGSQVPGSTQGQDMFLQGTHVSFKLGNTPITAGYSNSNDLGTAKDAAYQSSVYSSPKTITYLGAKINRGVFGNVKIAVSSSFGTGVNNNSYSTTSSASDNVAITMTKDMNIGRMGNLTLDVSKSTTLYNNNYQVGSDVLLAQKSGVNLNTNNDLFEAIGVGLTHHLDIQEIGFSDNVYYNYSGMGYQNPGNNGSGGARMKMGGSIRKSFNKNKLVLNLRTDLRNMPISYTTNDQWKNYQVQLDSRYMISKKFNMSFKYTASGTDKQIDDISTPVYSFQKMQIDGNVNYKIGKNFTVSHFSIGKQDFTNSYVSASGGSMLLMNYTQSMVFNRNSLTANILYNKELSSLQLLGNLFNSDISYTYQILQKVNMSSGLTYLNNTGIASQAGIRQSLQLTANSHFDLGTYIDIRKNMITPLYPDLYAACRAELSLKYHLKN